MVKVCGIRVAAHNPEVTGLFLFVVENVAKKQSWYNAVTRNSIFRAREQFKHIQ